VLRRFSARTVRSQSARDPRPCVNVRPQGPRSGAWYVEHSRTAGHRAAAGDLTMPDDDISRSRRSRTVQRDAQTVRSWIDNECSRRSVGKATDPAWRLYAMVQQPPRCPASRPELWGERASDLPAASAPSEPADCGRHGRGQPLSRQTPGEPSEGERTAPARPPAGRCASGAAALARRDVAGRSRVLAFDLAGQLRARRRAAHCARDVDESSPAPRG